jgi:hypothetical protein
MAEISMITEGSRDQSKETLSKVRNLPMCRIIVPNETMMFGKKQIKNIGNQPTIACEISADFTENQVLDTLEKQLWYPEYAEYRQQIIDNCPLKIYNWKIYEVYYDKT